MAQDAQRQMTEAELEDHLNDLLNKGAGIEDLEAELLRLGITNPDAETGEDGKLVLEEDDVAPGSDRKYPNVRDMAKKMCCDPQDIVEGMLRKRKRLWDEQARAQKIRNRNVTQADAWLKEMKKPFASYDARLQFMLEEYMHDFHPGEKTVKLIEGMLKETKCQDRVVWDEDAALMEVVVRLVDVVYANEGKPQSEADKAILEVARGVVKEYSKSKLKEGLKAKGRVFVDEDGQVSAYVSKVPPAEATRFAIVQDGVGTKATEVDDE